MTTASSFSFSAMDIPLMDDTMEMASPYQGHADDFEIDIDAMEDQASNPDRDMTAADEYTDNSLGTNYGLDGLPDDDMVDDVAEPSMIDAEEYRDTNQDIGGHYEEGKTYEEEMLEDDFDEDIDAPVPKHEREAPASFGHADIQEAPQSSSEDKEPKNGDQSPVALSPRAETEILDKAIVEPQPDSEQAVDHLDGQRSFDDSETTHMEPEITEKTEEIEFPAGETDDAGQIDTEPTDNNDHQNPSADWQDPESKEDEDQAQPAIDEPKETEVISHEEEKVSEPHQLTGQEHGSADLASLHPVKVYYQDNEISLFPPREGDSSETFFLEDEGLAYEAFGKLFEACREILQSHINENELLVIDIEALNLQLTEDSIDANKVTLKQIVDVYLQLCHNDGIDGPEALYLTLSTRPTLAAELSGLLLAVSEGKGLSEIQSWEFYPEAEGASAEYEETAQEYEETYQESYPEEPQNASDNEGDQNLDDRKLEATSHDQATSNLGTENVELVEATDDVSDPVTGNDESPHATSPDLEEQKTDSTATIQPLPQDYVFEERLEPGEVEEYPYDNKGEENNEVEYLEGDEPGDEAHLEEESLVHIAESIVAPEETERDDTENLTEGLPEEYHDLESKYHEQPTSGEPVKTDVSHDNEDASAGKLQTQDNSKATEPLVDETSTTLQSNQISHLVDDSLDTAENLTGRPGDPSEAGDDASEPGEIDEFAEHAIPLPVNSKEAVELPFDEEEDYLDLGIADDLDNLDEDHDIVSSSHVSIKRCRELNDEHDSPETTTPEVKRSRSS
ncbi:hypothetical protein BDV12DRAFT_159739 [Aspergillus spectabilis]